MVEDGRSHVIMSSCHHVILIILSSCHHVRAWEKLTLRWEEPGRACRVRTQCLAPNGVPRASSSSSSSSSDSGKSRTATKPVPISAHTQHCQLHCFFNLLATKHTTSWVIRLAWPFLIAWARSESMPASWPNDPYAKTIMQDHASICKWERHRTNQNDVERYWQPKTAACEKLTFRSPVPGGGGASQGTRLPACLSMQ